MRGMPCSPVASLRWVTPGAATEGVTPLFFSRKTWRPFSSRQSCGATSGFFFSKTDIFLLIAVTITIAFLLLSLGCHPLEGVTPHLFYLSDLVSPPFFVIFTTKKFCSFGCHPLEGVTRGGSLPLGDATALHPHPGRFPPPWGRHCPAPFTFVRFCSFPFSFV